MSKPNATYIKGVRTRFRNILQDEINLGLSLLQANASVKGVDVFLNKTSKCIEKIKTYCDKVEVQSEKMVSCLEGDDDEIVHQIIDDDCDLCAKAMDVYYDLKQVKDDIVTSAEKQMKPVADAMELETSQIIQLQSDMQQLLASQLKQQERLSMKEAEQYSTVKLPKIDMVPYNGDKTKWTEFWDSFQCAVHNNSKLSEVEKFSYLRSKLLGDAKSAIAGLALSNENYKVAVDILIKRFGNVQEIVDLHYSQLINLQPASNKVNSLRFLLDSIERHLRSLEVLKQNISQDVFVSIFRSKLPEDVLFQLELQRGSDVTWTVNSLADRLRDYVTARERATKGTKVNNEKSGIHESDLSKIPVVSKQGLVSSVRSSTQALTTGTSSKQTNGVSSSFQRKCRYCSGRHWSDECDKYKTISARKTQIKGSCFKCLKEGHSYKECRSKRKCVYCGKLNIHHRSLCPEKFNYKENETISHIVNEVQETHDVPKENGLMSISEIVLMQTDLIPVSNPNTHMTETVRLLMDSGSHRSYISESLVNKLSLSEEGKEDIHLVTFGSRSAKTITTKYVKLNIQLKNGETSQITVNVVPVISGELQRKPLKDVSSDRVRDIMRSVDLADAYPTEKESSPIDLLIGNDYYLDFIHGEKIEIKPGLYLLASKFGWILSGRTMESDDFSEEPCFFINAQQSAFPRANGIEQFDKSLPTNKSDIEDFWSIESIGIVDKVCESEDAIAFEKIRETLKFEDGRYQVTWPWKQEDPDLPQNKELAMSRLVSTVRRMKRKPEILKKYDSVIKDQLARGVVEKVKPNKTDGIIHYIPHHAVITPEKTTTKLRVVYDASAKTRPEHKSLNECLYRGPVMLNDLCGILIRFRVQPIALVADIEKAFLQLGLQPSQRDVTRFFWLKDVDNPTTNKENIQEYRFTRVPFGVISNPFLLGATIEAHLDLYDSDIADIIKKNIYVDNLITGTKSTEKAKEMYLSAKEIFNEGSMNLREWMSNDEAVRKAFSPIHKSNATTAKILGHEWNMSADTLSVIPKITEFDSHMVTKRLVLRRLASVFDPLGLLCPIVLKGKVFLQELWSKGLDWDDNLCDKEAQIWSKIKDNLDKIPTCKLTRCISKPALANVQYRLLCFCDASEDSYATTIYLHQTANEQVFANLIFAKTRLAPVKKLSIPRLELLAVVIGMKCLDFVQRQLHLPVVQVHLWTDSQCVLHWINSEKQLPVFVRNRILDIKKHEGISVSYVPSHENPADIASRGTTVEKLKDSKLWWNGPVWLSSPQERWPTFETPMNEQILSVVDFACDVKQKTNSIITKGNVSPLNIEIDRFSSLSKLLRVTALVLRFIQRILRQKSISGYITSDELKYAEHLWLNHVQKKNYPDIFDNSFAKKQTCIERQLGLYVDANGLLRCKGRLENADLCENARFPILLPKGDIYTTLVIEKCHKELLHSGVSQTLSSVRQRFWIPHGRAAVKAVVKTCFVCRRHEGGSFKLPPMCSLPTARVTASRPFSRVGLDYLGPLYVKENLDQKKVWICIFTCMVVRAIHLELVCDMSTSEFLLCFRRFISQRGTPTYIISDNAKQFRTASTILDQVWNKIHSSEDVWNYVSNAGIKWVFNVELSPWLGGFYERLIGLVKRSLKKTVGRRLLSIIQLQTLLKEVESVVNSRPLVYVNDDINSSIPITPAHFLSLNPKTGIPELESDRDQDYQPYESTVQSVFSHWKKGQKALDSFWKIWREDYLLSLRERIQNTIKSGRIHSHIPPKLNEVVLVKDTCSRGQWKFGKIIKLAASRDGLIRSATVLLPSGKEIRRPVNLLYPLEVSAGSADTKSRENTPVTPVKRAQRNAAVTATKQIKDILNH